MEVGDFSDHEEKESQKEKEKQTNLTSPGTTKRKIPGGRGNEKERENQKERKVIKEKEKEKEPTWLKSQGKKTPYKTHLQFRQEQATQANMTLAGWIASGVQAPGIVLSSCKRWRATATMSKKNLLGHTRLS